MMHATEIRSGRMWARLRATPAPKLLRVATYAASLLLQLSAAEAQPAAPASATTHSSPSTPSVASPVPDPALQASAVAPPSAASHEPAQADKHAPTATGPEPSAAATSPVSVPGVLNLRPAPPEIAAFPARYPAQAQPTELGVEAHGFIVGWMTPWSQTSPTSARETYRLRFGVLRVDARPARDVSVMARLGLMLPNSPLLDFAASYIPHDAFGITVGQFRLPIGASATTLAPQLVLLDRPTYIYAMTKVAFRDVGVMLHSSPRGIAGGVFHYWLVAAGGGGRAGVGASRAIDDLTKSLFTARILLDAGPLLWAADRSNRLALGMSYSHSTDPAISSGDAARDRELAANVLGRTLVPIGYERVTQLAGVDLTFVRGPWFTQAELLYLHSEATHADARRRALGAHLDLAYTLPVHPWQTLDLQLALRGEHFDPRLGSQQGSAASPLQLASLGLNAIAGNVRASVFGTLTFFESDVSHQRERAAEITLRTAAAF